MYNDKIILITGGTGSWGNELTKQLLEKYNPKEIRIYSRGELAQVIMKRKFNSNKLKFIIGDVRSLNRMNEAMHNVDIVFHLAALKHVPVCEDNAWESVNTNIIGVENVIRSAISNNVNIVCDISTDKACNPLNQYGACKSVGEKLMISANNRDNNLNTKFVCVRAGNVIGSNGSVIPFFEDLAKKHKVLPITDINMTRYFMTLPQAITMVFKAVSDSKGGEIFVTKMPAANIKDLAEVIWSHYNDEPMKYEVIGARSGEKQHEMLVSEHESKTTISDFEFNIILPMNYQHVLAWQGYPLMKDESYTSNQNIMNKHEIKSMLQDAGYLK